MDPILRLNLPPADVELRRNSEHTDIYDPVREKFVALTPEEWVRQNFIAYLMSSLGFPRGLMVNEAKIRLNTTLRRIDTLVYARTGMRPLMVIEYKAPHVAITQKVFDQIARYNMVVGAPWLIVSNGMSHYCCRYSNGGGYVFVPELPHYDEL